VEQPRTTGSAADQIAEFIGRRLGELLNQKDTLAKQLADVETQLLEVRQQVTQQFGSVLPATRGRRKGKRVRKTEGSAAPPSVKKGGRSGNDGSGRKPISDDARARMAEAQRRRWSRYRQASKG
jgi:hypothetical protein